MTPRPSTLLAGMMLFALVGNVRGDENVSFSRDVLPILSAKCFACHGPDEETREADLRLDDRDAALESGAFLPGDSEQSELIRRIFAEDESERMPPKEVDPLTSEQQDTLRRWVDAGAVYSTHWAFVPPERPPVPETMFADRVANEIDNFVFSKLEQEGLAPSPEADRDTLIRRVSLDLTGLLPTPEEADAFANSTDPAAYEQLVDRLLDSKQYGEHWARYWLDLARYSDTNGYEKDRPRSIWPYRDWVISALNDDMPFDQFTIEQLAGDMLPNATTDQLVATGFHRNTMLNEEGGIDPLEYRFYAMVDRVATTGTVWLGLSTGCAQCHTHKYDPISHTEYYRLMALLNNADEVDQNVSSDAVDQERAELLDRISQLEAALPSHFPPDEGTEPEEERRQRHYVAKYNAWLTSQKEKAVSWTTIRPNALDTNLPRLELLDDGSILSSGDITKRDVFTLSFDLDGAPSPITALRLEVLPDDRLPAGGPGRAFYEGRKGDFFLSELTANVNSRPIEFTDPSHTYGKISIGSGSADAANVIDGEGSTGWSTSGHEGQANHLVLNLKEPLSTAGELRIEMVFERHFAASLGRFRFTVANAEKPVQAADVPVDVESLLTASPDDWTKEDHTRLRTSFNHIAPELADARAEIDKLREQLPSPPETMVMSEWPAGHVRETFRHHRGEYLSPREPVEPGVPAVFKNRNGSQPQNRLEFAQWLVSDDHPLTSRVTVNRAWQAFFGIGLVESSGDFGTQSEPPSHPDLLDWLAREFVEGGWSLKRLHRLIVMSATYRQSSHASPDLMARDPRNRLLDRGPRVRLRAETIRDVMLQASGLLSPKMFGPSVYPPQPSSVTALAYGNTEWNVSEGEDRYRRSLYTFSKRTAPFAAYATFDAPSGETCTSRRDRSNTPLQSLTLLNSEMYLEMSRALAELSYRQHAVLPQDCLTNIFRRVLTRPPTEDELNALLDYQQTQLARLNEGELSPDDISGQENTSADLASWMMVARVVMNLDEAITKP
ncbi:MAG: PSD1 domain-containing protein [Planctomycetaceae bacterium]|nr:PSD1 domain-containing protein [Planctomycetaceae bacterium]